MKNGDLNAMKPTGAWLRKGGWLLLGWLALLVPQTARAEIYGDLSIDSQASDANALLHGYDEYVFMIVNHANSTPHSVRLVMDHERYGHGVAASEKTVMVAPGAQLRVALMRPAKPRGYYGFGGPVKVSVDGVLSPKILGVGIGGSGRTGTGGEEMCLLVSRALNSDDFATALETHYGRLKPASTGSGAIGPVPRAPAGGSREYALTRSEKDVSAWSDNWLSYSSFDGVVMTAADYASIPQPVAAALRRYAEVGGAWIVLGTATAPAGAFTSAGNTHADAIQMCGMGFGMFASIRAAQTKDLSYTDVKTLVQMCGQTLAPWKRVPDKTAANVGKLAVGSVRIPFRALLCLIIGFTVLIGPVNVFVLARKNKRIWLLWTAPAISLLTCLIVLLYALFSEGITPTIRTRSVTVLDERTHLASTIGMAGYYCPLVPGSGLHFEPWTEITACDGPVDYRAFNGRSIDWTRDQCLRGWLESRIPAHLCLRKSENRQERLAVTALPDGTMRVVNGLGAKIAALWLADAQGRCFEARNIEAGGQAILGAATAMGAPAMRFDTLRNWYADNPWSDFEDRLASQKPVAYLRPGSYIAKLEGSPFLEHGLPRKAHLQQEAIVLGILNTP